jgi:hypothetical protein
MGVLTFIDFDGGGSEDPPIMISGFRVKPGMTVKRTGFSLRQDA